MNLKKKLEDTKSKIKRHAPELIIFGSAVAAVAIGFYAINKNAKKADTQDVNILMSPSETTMMVSENPVTRVAGADREKIVGDESFELYKVEDDFYFLSNAPFED